MKYIAIDPGKNGALALIWGGGVGTTIKMPETPKDLYQTLKDLDNVDKVLVENVGGSMPGNAAKAARTFARHCGHIEMALIACGFSFDYVTPQKWMKKFLGTVPKDKKQRKNAIKEKAQRLYPHIKVTLGNADALGMLTYMMEVV